jgi:hypothetical protein
MSNKEFEKIANKAINAAQQVIYDAGIEDLVVQQLGFANAEDIKAGKENLEVTLVHKCKCWDCVNTNGGRCVCCGPACNC